MSSEQLTAYLQHGKWGGPLLTESVPVKATEAPRNPYAGGYGSRIPTQYMVQWRGKWRRVYAVCWSNVATLYIRERGTDGRGIAVDISREG